MTWMSDIARVMNSALRRFDVQIVRGTDVWKPTSRLGSQPSAPPAPGIVSEPALRVFSGAAVGSPQEPFDFAVVMPTIFRPSIADALRSVFEQDFPGRVQVLIGIDAVSLDSGYQIIESVCRAIPARHSLMYIYPGYSTSRRHGGVHAAWDGGSLRTTLSYLANSRYVAYLDDDNWWAREHLAHMREALRHADWAYALRTFVHPQTRRVICHDEWESVGPGKGMFAEPEWDWGGWVDPNCLAVDKLACEGMLRWWSIPRRNSRSGMDADRNVFSVLSREFKGQPTGRHTVFYAIDERDPMHAQRLQRIGPDRYAAAATPQAAVTLELARHPKHV